ncbi:MAG: PEP-CTERM sorting domain-containing protein [Methylomonas sp.]|nr:PEP-CTERM sorting domain-containing protein [Methylomonas sp.]
MKKTIYALVSSIGLAGAVMGQAEAASIVDQQQTITTIEGVALLPFWTSIGQSFTPTLNSIDWVEFSLMSESGPVTASLAILDGVAGTNGLGGTILGQSADITIPIGASLAPVVFNLPTAITLNPGSIYVAELILKTSGALKFAGTGQKYAGGQEFQSRYSTSFLAGEDLYFREGISTADGHVPEPATLGLMTLGLAGMRLRRKATR